MEGMDIDNMDDHEVDMLLESADVDWNKSLNVTKLGVVGRNEEFQSLVEAYDRIRLPEEPSRVVLIHGESGTGKTTLVGKLKEEILTG